MNENFRFLRPLLRGLPLVILAMVLSVMAAKHYLNYVTPMYESTAKMRLADVQEGVYSANLYKDFDVFASANKINSEIEVLKSSMLIKKTLSELPFSPEIYRKGEIQSSELFHNSPFRVEATFRNEQWYDKKFSLKILSRNDFLLTLPGQQKQIAGSFGKAIPLEGGMVLLTLEEEFLRSKPHVKLIDQYEFEFLSQTKLVNKVSRDLDIVAVEKEVPVIRINYKSSVPEKAALLVNRLAETYIQDYIENKYKAANTTVDFLKGEIENAHQKLTRAENRLENFKILKNIINIPQETETDLRKVAQLKVQQGNLRMSLNAVKDLNRYLARGKTNFTELAPNFEAFNDLLSTELVKNIKKLEAEKKELLLTYTPEHEKVKVVDAKIQDLADYQMESIRNTERNLQLKYNDISRDVAVAEQAFIGLPEKEKILATLNREFNLYEKNYNFLNEKRIDAEIAKSAKISFHKIITPGEVSKEPVSPVRSIIIIVAAVLGMMASAALIYLVHLAKAKVNDLYTIEQNSNIPVAFTVPFLKDSSEKKVHFLESVLELELKEIVKNQNIITLTSFDEDRHHLFVVKNLMEALESQSRKVLLIDATAAHYEGNFKHVLRLPAEEALTKTRRELQEWVTQNFSGFDLCLINSKAIKQSSLSLMLMKLAHQNLFVLDSRKTPEKRILETEILTEEYHLPKVWFVLNRAGYNPSVIKGAVKHLKRCMLRWKSSEK